ncbi:helix-turn-helix domain-containing protein [Streptosporangium jomthongense]|uniref:Helix-turn-helix domain-containing protein n=1 Tax=Streptosporangium jomthongense TaxID=1193683 RepID=A0ABV8EVR8_9ACTN
MPRTGPIKTHSTVRLRRLARELRQLRAASGWTTEEAASQIGWSRSKLNRMETGEGKPSPGDMATLCDLYSVPEPTHSALVTLAKEAGRRGWWTSYKDVFVGSYVGLEDEATIISEWGVQLIPGLLQTEDYARAVINTGAHINAEEVDRRVMARMARRTLVSRPNAPELRVVLDESVLHRPIGGVEVMNEQLRALVTATKRPNVSVRVLPFAAGEHAGLEGSFIILEFDQDDDLDIAYVEGTAGDVYVESSDHVDRYKVTFERICKLALPAEESRMMIAKCIKE